MTCCPSELQQVTPPQQHKYARVGAHSDPKPLLLLPHLHGRVGCGLQLVLEVLTTSWWQGLQVDAMYLQGWASWAALAPAGGAC